MAPKSALKAIRANIDAGDYFQAAVKASELCVQDPKNYHAYVAAVVRSLSLLNATADSNATL